MAQFYIVLAHARSGSTLLCEKLASLTSEHVYLEIFHHNIDVIKQHLKEDANAVLNRISEDHDQALRDRIAENPLQLLDAVSAVKGDSKSIFFKVFPGHLGPERLAQVLGQCSGTLILFRNLLHSFLSNQIATRNNKWANFDTSESLTRFDPEAFLVHVKSVSAFYKHAEGLVRATALSHAHIHYEELAKPGETDRVLTSALNRINVPVIRNDAAPGIMRQDKRSLATDKVSNPDELLDYLRSLGLEEANDASTPLRPEQFMATLSSV